MLVMNSGPSERIHCIQMFLLNKFYSQSKEGQVIPLRDGHSVLFGPFLHGTHNILHLRAASVAQHLHNISQGFSGMNYGKHNAK